MGTVKSDFFAARNLLPPLVCVALIQIRTDEAVLQNSTEAQRCFKLDNSLILTLLRCF